jgi:hypothetical protein
MEDILAIVMVFGTGIVGLIAFSPIGRAIAERIRHKDGALLPTEELDDLRAQLQQMQEQVSELAERQDFTERVIAKKEKGAIGGGAAS